MSDTELDSEAGEGRQQDGSPLSREVDPGGRRERRHSSPLDPEATRDDDDDDDNNMVEPGGRTRDTAADDVRSDDAGHSSFVQHGPCSPPIQQRHTTSGMAAATSRMRSAVSKPVQLQLMGESSGSGMLRLCRPQRSEGSAEGGNLSTTGPQRGASAGHQIRMSTASADPPVRVSWTSAGPLIHMSAAFADPPIHMAGASVVCNQPRSTAVHGVSDLISSTGYRQQCYRESSEHRRADQKRCNSAPIDQYELNMLNYEPTQSSNGVSTLASDEKYDEWMRIDQNEIDDDVSHHLFQQSSSDCSEGQRMNMSQVEEIGSDRNGWNEQPSARCSSKSICSSDRSDYSASGNSNETPDEDERRVRMIRCESSRHESSGLQHSSVDSFDEQDAAQVQFDESSSLDPRTDDKPSWHDVDIMIKLDELRTGAMRDQLWIRELITENDRLVAENEQLRLLSSTLTSVYPCRKMRRPMGRCYRCGLRGHLRTQCTYPRRPRRRQVQLEAESGEGMQNTVSCNRVRLMDDMSESPIIGGPADGGLKRAVLQGDNLLAISADRRSTFRTLTRGVINRCAADRGRRRLSTLGDADAIREWKQSSTEYRRTTMMDGSTSSALRNEQNNDLLRSSASRTAIDGLAREATHVATYGLKDTAGCSLNSGFHDGTVNGVTRSGGTMAGGTHGQTNPTFTSKAMETVKGETRRSTASSVANRERYGDKESKRVKRRKASGGQIGSQLIGGPADGSVGCCGRGGRILY